MRHVRSYLALLTIAAITVACTPGSSSGESQGAEPSTGSQPSQAAASQGGGGGGGGGANGSITYEITGDYQASGELPFQPIASTWVEQAGGWAASFANADGSGAYILVNTQAAEGTTGQIFTFGDGVVILTAISTAEEGNDCTFNLTKNDSTGLTGDLHCDTAIAADVNSGARKTVQVTAQWDAHP